MRSRYEIKIKFHSIPPVLPLNARVQEGGIVIFIFESEPSEEDKQKLLDVCIKLNPTPSIKPYFII
jgi:hypothetical protein